MSLSYIWFAILKYGKDCLSSKRIKISKSFLKHLRIGSHGNCSAELFGGQKPCYDGQ